MVRRCGNFAAQPAKRYTETMDCGEQKAMAAEPQETAAQEMTCTVHRERVLLAGGARSLVLQLAHPSVAQGVADYSTFPHGALQRLRRTLDLSLALIYGNIDAAAARIRMVHERVRGRTGGISYRANDPRLLLWVHATLIDSTMEVYQRFVRPLPETAWRCYYEEQKLSGTMLGIPEDCLPADLDAFRDYFRGMLEGDELRATLTSRRLVNDVLRPPLPLAYRPATELSRLVTIALLPVRVRRMFCLRAGAASAAALASTAAISRRLLPLLPDRARTFRAARIAMRQAADRA